MSIVSMPLLTLELPYPSSSGNHSVKHGGGRHYLTKAALDYRAAVRRLVLAKSLAEPLDGPLEVEWIAAPPDRRARDADNAMKVAGDALTLAGVWKDDSNKVIRRTTFEWTDPVPGGAIAISITQFKR